MAGTVIIDGSHLSPMLSAWAAGLTAAKYPLGSGECWDRAKAAAEHLDHLPLRYVEGWLHHPTAMGETGSGQHGFLLLGEGEELLVVDPMVGEYLVSYGEDREAFSWELRG